ncbi:MAG: neutral/alkaline non-lysosomal ceramidase N-terminal domain-containing protein [Planctomycetaceae bacterium]|nr:neutral/alkaline non-lysosomal ceramidase N-terminal domain-containing protein [Planctomycetaceae bacterium]
MFRIVPILSVVLLALSSSVTVFAADADKFKVGLASVEITPPVGYPLSGYYHERKNTGALDPLHAKAMVFAQGDTRLALIACDILGISADLAGLVREQIEAQTGIPGEQVLICGTHTHTGPDYARDLCRLILTQQGKKTETKPTSYPAALVEAIAQSAVDASKNLQPLEMLTGSGEETSVAFNRRFVMKDGTISTWANFRNQNVVRSAGPIDPELDILMFRSPAGKPVGALSVYALHLDTTGGDKCSADFPAYLERMLKSELDPKFFSAFGAGTCGDINHVNPRAKERNRPDFIGSQLGKAFLTAMKDLQPVKPDLAFGRSVLQIPMQTYSSEELAEARATIKRIENNEKIPTLEKVKAFKIIYLDLLQQGSTETLFTDPQRKPSVRLAGTGKTIPIEIQVFQIGEDTAIVGLPGEVFVDLGLTIKRLSPYRQTIVIELSNSNDPIYIPTRLSYQGGGYEPTNSVIQPGGGEEMVAETIRLLREVKSR